VVYVLLDRLRQRVMGLRGRVQGKDRGTPVPAASPQ
jgi:multidrug efflux pump